MDEILAGLWELPLVERITIIIKHVANGELTKPINRYTHQEALTVILIISTLIKPQNDS